MPPGGEEEKVMKNSRKMKKWGCVMLALMSGFILPAGAVTASSGLSDTPQIIDEENCYVGIKGASGNEVIIDSDLKVGAIGGYADSDSGDAEASNNSVTMNDGGVENCISGGYANLYSGNAVAKNNSVTVNGGTVKDSGARDIYISGGYAYTESGDAYAGNNRVTVNGGTVEVSIYGGDAYSYFGDITVENNSVTVNGGTVEGWIEGGCAYFWKDGNTANRNSVTAKNNRVTVSGGTVESYIRGGYASSSEGGNATAENNSMTMSGGTVKGTIYGGLVDSYEDGNATANNNSVAVSGGTVKSAISGGGAFSDSGDATAENNRVTVSGGTVESYIRGGYARSYEDGNAIAENNSVTISGGKVAGEVYGGYVRNMESSVTDNSVTISGGTVTGKVYGGYVGNMESSVTDNSVTISSGTVVNSHISGGYTTDTDSKVKGNTVTGNSITLSGTADVSGADLYGSNLSASGTNNNLVINGWSGAVKSLHNFDQIQVKALSGGLNLTAGKRTVFVNNADRIFNSSLDPTEAKEMQAGVALTVNGNVGISEDNKNIYIDVTAVRASDQTAIATESRAASVAVVGRGSEAVTDSLDALRGSGEGLDTFAAVVGSRSRYDTGSHVDVNGWNGIAGTAWTRELSSGTLRYGAFYENGGGSYDTFNTINGSSYRGSGDTVYNGGGLLLRWETRSGTYTEASLRAGMVKNEVGQALEFAGNRYGFKTENNYYGGHVGIGRIMERDDGDAWDIYGKYFHMHHEGDTVTIAGDEFAFNAVDSNRLRVGARYLDRKNDRFTGYYGVAWDYEFSGDTGGTANHHAMYTPSLKGSTLIAEIGFRGTPGGDSPWSFGVDLRGYAGEQEGLSGTVTAAYSF